MRRIASGLGLAESLRDQACQLFRSAQAETLLRGRSIESVAAASVFGACRCARAARLLSEVAAHARVADSRVENAYQALNTDLGLPAPPVTTTQFVSRLAAACDCSDPVRRRGRALTEKARDATVTAGVHPAGFAAACLYVAGQEHDSGLTQATVAAAAGVTLTTIQSHRDTLVEQVL
ncbi:transcription initiation factor IIB [Halorubrum californiense DSM 19288]|uniref:Transcription initiation factor IIB n=1 Tax=Halorubrum californiense DSM 19288 TaxID=1227465 RepID=M0E7K3_9EURY|nr:transcription initiation factor IIB [Halorubrum californiense DSM 19288]